MLHHCDRSAGFNLYLKHNRRQTTKEREKKFNLYQSLVWLECLTSMIHDTCVQKVDVLIQLLYSSKSMLKSMNFELGRAALLLCNCREFTGVKVKGARVRHISTQKTHFRIHSSLLAQQQAQLGLNLWTLLYKLQLILHLLAEQLYSFVTAGSSQVPRVQNERNMVPKHCLKLEKWQGPPLTK